MKSHHPLIRRLLQQYHDGLTTAMLAERLDVPRETMHRSIRAMPDVYIDRWTAPKLQAPSEIVWCVVVVPEDCPKPSKTKKVKKS